MKGNNKVNYDAIDYANDMGANLIEIHTGYFSKHIEEGNLSVVNEIESLINKANQSNLMVNAGHDLNLINLPHLVKIGGINEVSIGHAIVIDALNYGFEATIKSYIDTIKG
jgi:pyridoxine 5-phosphate synthase